MSRLRSKLLWVIRRGYTFELSGRVDGLISGASATVVEEVKSVTLEGSDLDLLSARETGRFIY